MTGTSTTSMSIPRRINATLIAPEASPTELLLGYGAAVAGAIFAVVAGLAADWTLISVTVIGLVAFDLFGGATVNALPSAKRWFHRPGRTARHHLAFVAVHVQPFLVALVVPGFGWWTALVVYLTMLGAAAVVLAAPPALRRPVGYALATLSLAIIAAAMPVPAAIAWFVPVLSIKLLLAHLQSERDGWGR
ncbi:hypothetical protein [Nocardia vermiculata]|nr:hypothetical protein [Nocardia vermiculata]